MLPVIDLERWAEPLPEIADVIDWEQQVVEGQTDEDLSDSEYNLTDEYESEGEEQEILSINSSDESEYSDDVDVGVANPSAGKAALRRSRRKNHKSEVRNDGCDLCPLYLSLLSAVLCGRAGVGGFSWYQI